jgi:hypothetical protein
MAGYTPPTSPCEGSRVDSCGSATGTESLTCLIEFELAELVWPAVGFSLVAGLREKGFQSKRPDCASRDDSIAVAVTSMRNSFIPLNRMTADLNTVPSLAVDSLFGSVVAIHRATSTAMIAGNKSISG